jgi:hypothetical protein
MPNLRLFLSPLPLSSTHTDRLLFRVSTCTDPASPKRKQYKQKRKRKLRYQEQPIEEKMAKTVDRTEPVRPML